MLLLDGIEYLVKTPEENTDDLISFINDYCEANQIKNSLGEVIYIEKNEANPLYQWSFGLSYLTTVMQKLIYNAGCSISISESSPRQLLNLSDISGIKRTTATRTVIRGIVYSNLEDVGAVPCVITQEMTATIMVAGTDVVFHPAFDVTIPIGESRSIILIAEELGAYNIAENTITQFDDEIAGFRSMKTYASTPGQDTESIASLRERLQRRSVTGTQIDRAASAIQDLEGVAMCSIVFNYSPSEDLSIPYGDSSLIIPPRMALLLVQGWSNDIAKVFYRYLFCATTDGSSSYAQELTYTTRAGQDLSVYVIPPYSRYAYIRVFIKNTLSYEQVSGIKDTICTLAGSLQIGNELTSTEIIDIVKNNYSNLTIQGAEVSLDGESYSYKVTPYNTDVLMFSIDKISIVEV